MDPIKHWLTPLAVAGLALSLVTGCSSSGGGGASSPSPSASPTGEQTYTDPNFGFTFTYRPPMTLNTTTSAAMTSGSFPNTIVAVADPNGTKLQNQVADLWSVSAYQLAIPVTADNMRIAQGELEKNVIPQLESKGLKVGDLTPTKVAGSPAFVAEATATAGKTTVQSRLIFVLAGSTEYQIIEQAVEKDWKKLEATYAAITKSFTVPSESTSSSTPASSSSS